MSEIQSQQEQEDEEQHDSDAEASLAGAGALCWFGTFEGMFGHSGEVLEGQRSKHFKTLQNAQLWTTRRGVVL